MIAENELLLPRTRSSRTRALLLMCALSGCAFGCEEEKPYTPFQVASSLPSDGLPQTAEKVAETPEAKPARVVTALRAPAGKTKWKAFDRILIAPSGTEFLVGIPNPNSESDDVFAWVLGSDPAKPSSESGVWVFEASGRPTRRLLPVPDYLPQGEDCRREVNLEASGARSVTARISSSCESDLLAGTPTSSVSVLDATKEDPVLLHLRTSTPSPGERLELAIDSSDRDGDAQDDVELTVALTAPSGTKESLPLRWLTRTAGASREPDAPSKELAKRVSRLLTASIRKAERAAAPAQVDALRRLLSSLCSELGKPKVERASGETFKCGDIGESINRLVKVNVQSYLGEDRLVRALGEVERASWFGKHPQPANYAELLQPKIESIDAKRLAAFRVEPLTSSTPYRTPLLFDDRGQLWTVTSGKMKRLTMEGDPPLVVEATEDEPEQRIEPPEWSIESKGSNGKSLRAAIPSCERSEVLLAFAEGAADDSSGKPLPLPLLAPRPGDCAGFAPPPLPIVPLMWSGSTVTFALGGEALTNRGHEPSGTTSLAWGTSLGVALLHEGKLTLLTGNATKGLHHCTVDEKAVEVACLSASGVTVLSGKKD